MRHPARALLIVVATGLLLAGMSCTSDKKDLTSASTTTTTKAGGTTSTTTTEGSTTTAPGATTGTTDPYKASSTTTAPKPTQGSDPNSPVCKTKAKIDALSVAYQNIDPKVDLPGFKTAFSAFNQAYQDFAKAAPSEVAQPAAVIAGIFNTVTAEVVAAKTAADLVKVQNDVSLEKPPASDAIKSLSNFFTGLCGSA